MDFKYAERMDHLKASEIRELLKMAERPDIISFAGGLPAPELFPIPEIVAVSRCVLEESGQSALQYSTTEGYAPLRKWIAERLNRTRGTDFDADNILITHGSQQALDLSGKVFLDAGDTVLCECPTYLAAISAFKAYGCSFGAVLTDDEGMIPEALEEMIKNTERVKLIYMISDFQNPTGQSWSLARRKKLAEIAAKYGIVVLEDNPYGELRFEGEFLPSVKAFDTAGAVFCLGTFSKIFCPGYRIGWIAGDKQAIAEYVIVKQGTDLQCNTLAQMEIAKFLELYDIDAHIEKIRAVYKRRRDLALETMAAFFPEGVSFTRPQGGLFTWVELPEQINARVLLEASLQKKVAFVPGGSFFPNAPRENTFRINYSSMPEARIIEGMKILGDVIKTFLP